MIRPKQLYICCDYTKCDVVRRAASIAGFKEISDARPSNNSHDSSLSKFQDSNSSMFATESFNSNKWHIIWFDTPGIQNDRNIEIKSYQKINHFAAMSDIARKDSLARNLNRMNKLFPKDYNFYPKSWILPSE